MPSYSKNHLVGLEYSDVQEFSILFFTAFQYEPPGLSHTHLNAKDWCEEKIDNQEMCASGEEYRRMNGLLDKIVVGFYESRFEEML